MTDTIFDVLVVYTEAIATSASSAETPRNSFPFSLTSKQANYNTSYEYFLTMCAKYNLKAAFTTSADIIGTGLFSSYWLFEENTWIKVNQKGYSRLIFDKFSPINKLQELRREVLFSSQDVKPFNDADIFSLFFDKYKTFDKFQNFSIPTVILENNNRESILQACTQLKNMMSKHPYKNDFKSMVVLKDRFGAGGNNIYKIEKNIQKSILTILQKNEKTSFILQPFIKFDKGYSYKNSQGFTDIRLIYIGKKLVQTYIRVAKKRDFRCNEHQGGILTYITKKDIPKKVKQASLKILQVLGKRDSLFALDFIVSNNNNIYFLEGNTGPGIDWNVSKKEHEKKTKSLIHMIVKELDRRTIKVIPDISIPTNEMLPLPVFNTL